MGGPINPWIGDPTALFANASNIFSGDNPPFTNKDFYTFYPQFQGALEDAIVTKFVGLANATVQQVRWQDAWELGMCLFVAHFCTLYLQTLTPSQNPGASAVMAAAQARGLQTSKSVGNVSVAYDYSHLTDDLPGWAAFKSTQFGIQFATLGQMFGKAGIYVH